MATSRRRRYRRLQLGENRKSTAIRWIGGLTVGVNFPRVKADEGAEKSFLTRKTRRGQRGGISGLGRLFLDREAARLLVSAVRSAAPRSAPALDEKIPSPRKVNHMGRKHIWAEVAANRLARRKPVQQLIKKVPDDWGYMSRSAARRAVADLGVGTPSWERYRDWWHLYSYKCRHMGARPRGKDPMSFLAGENPKVGAADLMDFLSRSDLPRAASPPPVRRPRVCMRPNHVGCAFLGHDWQELEPPVRGPRWS